RSAEARFVIQSLGGFHVRSPETGQSMPWRTKKERELCAFLVHHEGKPASAASIIEALWPGYELDKAKTYLYTCLSYLRKSLSDQGISIRILKNDQGFIASYGERTFDATEFERLLRIAIAEEEADERLFIRFESMYKGEYMEACDFAWADARQMGIKRLYIRALRSRYARLRIRGEAVLAAESLQRVLTLAPDSEADGRELIELYLEAGNRNEALRVFQRLEQAVRVQLGTELEEETIRLLQPAPAPAREDRKGRMLR
ncbi:MAG: winged helix-turn-helix domain-containing protein, partial [Cohnella sp.]|nr:winged helix-turn-helix domain-containing protein [Cohnella sp.]